MKKVSFIISFLIILFLFSACARKQYMIKSVDGYLVEMNNRFDSHADPAMHSIVEIYKNRLDAEMDEVIGEAAISLTKSGTQSLLANLTSDAMYEFVTEIYGGTIDFAVINNGGLRTSLNQGPITIGNMYEIYVFENQLTLLKMSGKAVKELFDGFAQRHTNSFSKNVRLVINNRKVETLMINGLPLDESAIYKVVTVDYLAEGNDGMRAFTQAENYIDFNLTLRDMMIRHIKKITVENKIVYAKPDDRIEIKE